MADDTPTPPPPPGDTPTPKPRARRTPPRHADAAKPARSRAASAKRPATSRTAAAKKPATTAAAKRKSPARPAVSAPVAPPRPARAPASPAPRSSSTVFGWRSAVGAAIAVIGAVGGLLALRGSTPRRDPRKTAHQADGTDSSASFSAGIADEGTIPEEG